MRGCRLALALALALGPRPSQTLTQTLTLTLTLTLTEPNGPNPPPPQVEARYVRVVCMVNAATHSLEGDSPSGPGGRARGGPGNDFARSIGFFSCGFASRPSATHAAAA